MGQQHMTWNLEWSQVVKSDEKKFNLIAHVAICTIGMICERKNILNTKEHVWLWYHSIGIFWSALKKCQKVTNIIFGVLKIDKTDT